MITPTLNGQQLIYQGGELSETDSRINKSEKGPTVCINHREMDYSMKAARKILLIPKVRSANSYLIRFQDDEATIVDTGIPGNDARIPDCARGLGIEPSSINTIVLTHPDQDMVNDWISVALHEKEFSQ